MSIYLAPPDTVTGPGSNVIELRTVRRRRQSSARTAAPFASTPTPLAPQPRSSTASMEPRATTTQWQSLEAELELVRALNLVHDEIFEDGVENELCAAIPRLIGRFGPAAVEATARLYLEEAMAVDVLAEVLRWLGRVEHEPSRDARFWFLIYCLRDDSPAVRSAAALGLASLEDTRAVPYLRRQAHTEPIDLLGRRLEKVANELAS